MHPMGAALEEASSFILNLCCGAGVILEKMVNRSSFSSVFYTFHAPSLRFWRLILSSNQRGEGSGLLFAKQ